MKPFRWIEPIGKRSPILLSMPHVGTFIPEALKNQVEPSSLDSLDDTDWFVDRLYAFASSMGIGAIAATHHRWVVDLNRNPSDAPLYNDGRIITSVCPTQAFSGDYLYRDKRNAVAQEEINFRLEHYFYPYHHALNERLQELKKEFGFVLLWDCHSIRQVVKTIQPNPFPDLILGNAKETSADKSIIELVKNKLEKSAYSFSHNHPFQGGYITRHYGKPSEHVHALQLEMTKVNYMNDAETMYDEARADGMIQTLQPIFHSLLALWKK